MDKIFTNYLAQLQLHYESEVLGLFLVNKEDGIVHSKMALKSGTKFYKAYWNLLYDLSKLTHSIVYRDKMLRDGGEVTTAYTIVGFYWEVEVFNDYFKALYRQVEDYIKRQKKIYRKKGQLERKKARNQNQKISIPHFAVLAQDMRLECINAIREFLGALLVLQNTFESKRNLKQEKKELESYIKYHLPGKTLKTRIYAPKQ